MGFHARQFSRLLSNHLDLPSTKFRQERSDSNGESLIWSQEVCRLAYVPKKMVHREGVEPSCSEKSRSFTGCCHAILASDAHF